MKHVRNNSKTGGRLNVYTNIKSDLATESYENSVDLRRVLADLRAGCLPLKMEAGWYTGTPYCQRICRLCEFAADNVHDNTGSYIGCEGC